MDPITATLVSYGVMVLAVGGSIYLLRKVERYDWINWRVKKNEQPSSTSSDLT